MKVKRLATALLSIALVGSTVACGKSDQEAANSPAASAGAASAKPLEPVTLKGMLWGDVPADMQAILAEFEKRTKDTLNTKLDIKWNPVTDHKQKVKLMMAAGEEADFVFDAEFMNLKELVPQGAYVQLDKYFNNDAYPGLKKAFPPEFIEANKRYDGHLYTIPLTQYFKDLDVIYIRKDLREKYGLAPIKSYADLEKFYDIILEKEKGLTPLALGGVRGFYMIHGGMIPPKDTIQSVGVSGVDFKVQLSDDLKKVLNIVAIGDPASEYAKLPAPFNTLKTSYPEYDKYVEWTKYLEKDVLSQKDGKSYFMSGKAASYEGTISSFAADRKKLKDANSSADLEYFVYTPGITEMKPKSIDTNYKANNNIAIPATSKNVERTMKFFDWLFSSRENHDLFEHGIKGKHWEPVGDNQIKLLDDSKSYVFPGYELSWNPNMIRIPDTLDDMSKKYLEYSAKADTYYASPLKKFIFDNTNVKAETANISSKYTPFLQMIKNGQYKDWPTDLEKMNKELKALGLDKVREEIRKQVQDYLDKGIK
ncbi:ABC transporter substrate-binding protein [Paenibacillus sedimenti]|uniref:ABC transporter substrate-binding protein n=1 Tax=Paenibacillus sedimenti TaxID=2770274 RepID=A0A926KT17_9BACL|nr:ABC transporter substrate-binding protein [Paenibacillus sedimenti]MBD0381485.1 ABC transporter substrate-binding protein [Paenibacillus sedimenti]